MQTFSDVGNPERARGTHRDATPSPVPVLAVSRLSVEFRAEGGWLPVVNDVSFTIGQNETVAVVGESGSGKSVTALSIMGLNSPAATRVRGTIEFNGRQLLDLTENELQKIRGNEIAMIFQEPMTSLNPVLSIGHQIMEALVHHRNISKSAAKAEAVRLLDRVRIPAAQSRLSEYPHRFSGGMRQRVMIAMALACKPKLLIADEPTTALDVTIQAQILELLREIQSDEQMAVLFITHDLGVVAEVAERTVVMYNGRAVEVGTTDEIFATAQHPYTKSLLASVPRLGDAARCERPLRFPIVDRETGLATAAKEVTDTAEYSKPPVLQVKGLTTRFEIRSGWMARVAGRVHAVENVSFDLYAGETLALVGESGCGKSTTGRSILRLLSTNSGSASMNGVDLLHLDARALREKRRDIQMIFQDPFAALNPRMTVAEAIAQPLIINRSEIRTRTHERVTQLLTDVGLEPETAARYPHEFSGGQRQRICIARALALNPKVLIADEAVSALDVSVKAQIVNLLMDLQEKRKLAYLFISHDMAVVERVSHRVAVMYLGEIVEIGPRSQVFGNPQHAYTKQLLSAVPVADPKRRLQRRNTTLGELRSPIRAPNFNPPKRVYDQVSPGHFVMSPT